MGSGVVVIRTSSLGPGLLLVIQVRRARTTTSSPLRFIRQTGSTSFPATNVGHHCAQVSHLKFTKRMTSDLIAIMNRLKPNWNKPFVLRRQIFRTVMPESDNCTGVHYDQVFLRQGPADSAITGWIPIGDCSAKSGGLMYMEDSLGFGQAMEKKFDEMSEAKGLDPEVRKLAYNVNVSVSVGLMEGRITDDVR